MTFSLEKSKAAFEEAKCYIPGGVNSPVRSFRAVGGTPPFIESAKGAKLYDIDGNEYIDYVLSWGPMILGHAHPNVIEALQGAVLRGTSYGAPTLYETALAKLISEMIPTMELVRMVNSGTEATMSVLRVARGFTGRSKIVKFEGCYHGHHDSLLVKAGSGAATFGVPDSPGVPAGVAQNTITVPYNDLEALEAVFKQDGNEIAAVIIEPVAGNMGLVLPKEGYLQSLRDLTKQYGILLIFDEVMCGFRCSLQGAQGLYGIEPDLTCLGKVIGGGLPVAAYGGRRDIMSCVSPAGPVYQAGTLSGNPLAMAAGFATLSLLKEQPELFDQMTESLTQLCAGMKREAEQYGLNYQFHQVGTMFCLFFTDQPVVNYDTAKTSDLEAFKVFFQAMLEQKIYLAPSQFETGFMSLAHSSADIEKTIEASGKAFAKVRQYLAAK